MAQGNPLPGEKYLHFKKKLYQIIAVAKHSETMEPYVVYQALYGDFGVYIRPYDMFVSEVDHEKYPEVTQKYRFQYVEPEMMSQKEGNESTSAMCQKEEYVSTSMESDNHAIEKAVAARKITADFAETGKTVEVPVQKVEKTTELVKDNTTMDDSVRKATKEAESTADGRNRKPELAETASDCEPENDVSEQINPWLLRFLDAETMEEKYQIVCDIKNDITDRLIDDLAVVVDVVIPEGKLSERYDQLKYCIRTRQKYEQTSLWRK